MLPSRQFAALPGVALLAALAVAAALGAAVGAQSSCRPTYMEREEPVSPEGPRRTNLREPGVVGIPLTLGGRVLDTRCRPVPRVLLEFWQTDGNGRYDEVGSRLHGHQYTDARGRWSLRTVVPGSYGTRTPHIHVSIGTMRGASGITELYMPSRLRVYGLTVGSLNASDRWFDRRNVIRLGPRTDAGYSGRFDFVLEPRG